jgi:hypothetical protein
MNKKLFRMTGVATTNVMFLTLLVVLTAGSNPVFAQAAPIVPIDPGLEVFRIRCQIDADINPVTGLNEPKVQIQAKARADLLDGFAVGIMVENTSSIPAPMPSIVDTMFEFGSATADWDTFPDPGSLDPAKIIPGDFVLADENIQITVKIAGSNQTATGITTCVDKTGGQFKQDTKNVCTLIKFNRGKCKSGDTLPDGTVMP